MTNRAPLIVAILVLLVPLLYVGSYLALVVPGQEYTGGSGAVYRTSYYRYGGRWAERIFWPLEQIDRKVRPGAWANDPFHPVLFTP
ncbi:hypothetical protein NA78x_005371 [Anatilimnocola sp. NA78]|uniref:hypothetical protein n=1 Tax=Anatilimnocola sp. NA78 TaxID=3415683 RepID=UPI003CE472EF